MKKTILNGRKSMGKLSLFANVALFSLVFVLSGCNTVEGVGEDIKEAGDRIEDAAD